MAKEAKAMTIRAIDSTCWAMLKVSPSYSFKAEVFIKNSEATMT